MIPSHQGEKVVEGGRLVSLILEAFVGLLVPQSLMRNTNTHDVIFDLDVSRSLAQLGSICVHKQRQMPEIRRREPKRIV